jgi:uncharacterized protein YbjQ (UPF0145 family)
MKSRIATIFLALLVLQPALGQESSAENDSSSQSGYDDLAEFGGPESVGGELKGVTKLIADGREQAFARMSREAVSLGANAVKGLRFSTSQVWEGAAEVMAYGTAVVVAPTEDGNQDEEAAAQCE